jgi:NAD(P)-dependent dehydrogenase (short-subunit alcohol dehydrogenase family)
MRILVTGAASGVGRATAALLQVRGHDVIASARNRSALDDLEVSDRLSLDVTDAASVDEVRRKLGWLDALVNNAAISFRGPIEHVEMQHVEQMFETNVFGPVRLIQAFVPAMRSRRSGVVVNISSVAGHVAQPLSGFYAATKHALEAISEALYVELAHFGVRVVVIEPGFIAPGMKDQAPAGEIGAYDELDVQLAEVARKMQGGARPGPELVAGAIADAIEDDVGPLRRPFRSQHPRGRGVREGDARRRWSVLVGGEPRCGTMHGASVDETVGLRSARGPCCLGSEP